MRALLAAAALVAGSGLVAQVDPPEPPVQHVYVQPGEGLWTVASRLCPHDPATVYVALQAANPWYTVGLHPGTVLHVPDDVCPPPTTTTEATTTTTALPPKPEFPNAENTGPRSAPTQTFNGTVYSSFAGQVIERSVINGNLVIRHDNVTVRDVLVNGNGRYMIQVIAPTGGVCPIGVLIEYTEVDGSAYTGDTASQIDVRCPAVIDHVHTHDMGLGVRAGSGSTITNSYLHADRTWTGAHREAIINNGPGQSIVVDHNTLVCVGPNCSSAMSLYGDFGQQDDWLITDNLFATTGGYCVYAGSEDHEAFPDATNIRIIGNRFSTEHNPLCGGFGYMTAFESGRGNEFTDNVWHETGELIPDQ